MSLKRRRKLKRQKETKPMWIHSESVHTDSKAELKSKAGLLKLRGNNMSHCAAISLFLNGFESVSPGAKKSAVSNI